MGRLYLHRNWEIVYSEGMEIFKEFAFVEFGSHVYGTSLPSSDRDYKGLFMPSPKQLLLQKCQATSINRNTKSDCTQKNTANDVDIEFFTLHGYIRLLKEGQTPALDMLFAPRKYWLKTSVEWEFMQENKAKLVHSGTSAFCGYVRQQAAKYGIKGSRVAAMRQAINALRTFPLSNKLNMVEIEALKEALLPPNEFIKFVLCKAPNGKEELYLEVCNRKVGLHSTFKYAIEIYQKVFEEYGARALAAETNQGVDWKALYHAVRVSHEALELLNTGHITFPRPEASILLQIRKGELPYREVAEIIERMEIEIKNVEKTSHLPNSLDIAYWEEWVYNIYKSHSKF
jgi:predicted nucleotidyltransferase